MLVDGVGLFNVINQRMDYLRVRHTLIAQNVAHADTPGYASKDLKPFKAMLNNSAAAHQLSATNAGHLAAAKTAGEYREDRTYEGWEVAPSNNSVLLEEEMIKASDSAKDYQTAASVMRKHITMLRAALNTRG
ncbi:flagellar basal body rod protein FlgB [Hyphococcus sp.]|jgi:flagellar basal-body rod protein FlgB|uniref:flagellar basal body rod protein FlgB n=1 Tax=Hyphococcus sp. TaxID=2038636 RepID=UPI003D0F2453